MIHFTVLGLPVTQGSKSAFVRGGRAIVVEGKGPGIQRHKDWRAAVHGQAQAAAEREGITGPLDGPVIIRCTFGLAKPASAPKRLRTFPIKARSGDLDKLARSILDSITGVIVADDSQVVALIAVKDWSERPGVTVEIRPAHDDIALDRAGLWCQPAPHYSGQEASA